MERSIQLKSPMWLLLAASDLTSCQGLGELTIDVAYGGNFMPSWMHKKILKELFVHGFTIN
jgi:proline racemase